MSSRLALCGVLALNALACARAGSAEPLRSDPTVSGEPATSASSASSAAAAEPSPPEAADVSIASPAPGADVLRATPTQPSSAQQPPVDAGAHDAFVDDEGGPEEGTSEAATAPVDAAVAPAEDPTASDELADAAVDAAEPADVPEEGPDPSTRAGATTPPDYALAGFAVEGAGTHGGSGDPSPVTVYSGAELQAAVDASVAGEPRTILVVGRITHEQGRVRLENVSRLSILGVGDDAELDGVALELFRSSDVIIRNLHIHDVSAGEGDAIRITDGSHHVWIDHCTLHSNLAHGPDVYDGLIDVSHGSDLITVSWNLLRDHFAASLIGHSDANAQEDQGKLRVTFHHNLWRDLGSRLPSVRFGSVHVFDNLYQNVTDDDGRTGSAISSRMGACVRLENNCFEDVRIALRTDESEVPGAVQESGNMFGSAEVMASPTCAFDPPYPYDSLLEPADGLPTSLPARVGVGKVQDPAHFDVRTW